jgi:hypothetical protein
LGPAATPATPPRAFAPIAFAVLALATVAAFATAQKLKHEPLLLDKVIVSPVFSPNGDHRRDRALVEFRVTRSDRALVQIIDREERVVRTLARQRLNDFKFLDFYWDGRTGTGTPAPTGAYRLQVRMLGEDRTLVPGLQIRLHRFPPPVGDRGGREGGG